MTNQSKGCQVVSDSGPEPDCIDATADAGILEQVRHGNFEHFDTFVDRYKARLMNYIIHSIRDVHRAEDITQDVFLRAFRASPQVTRDGTNTVAAWLFTIARNCVTDHLRAAGRKPLVLQSELPQDDGSTDPIDNQLAITPDPADAVLEAEGNQRVEAILDQLPPSQRDTVALKVFAELTFPEIAEATGCPLATAKSRMRYGLKKIREILSEAGRTDHE